MGNLTSGRRWIDCGGMGSMCKESEGMMIAPLVTTTTDTPPGLAVEAISESIERLRERAARYRDSAPSREVAESWEFIREMLADCAGDVRDEEICIYHELNRGRVRPAPAPSCEWEVSNR